MYNLLLADDERFILEGLQAMIPRRKLGIDVVFTASNGSEALDVMDRHKIDLLVTDVRMPGRTGLELLEAIRRSGWDTRVIVLSGYDEFSYVRDAARLGIDNYLLKPVNRRELVESLETAVRRLARERRDATARDEGVELLLGNALFRFVTGRIDAERFLESWGMAEELPREGRFQIVVADAHVTSPEALRARIRRACPECGTVTAVRTVDDSAVALVVLAETADGLPREAAKRARDVGDRGRSRRDDGGVDQPGVSRTDNAALHVGPVVVGAASIPASYWGAVADGHSQAPGGGTMIAEVRTLARMVHGGALDDARRLLQDRHGTVDAGGAIQLLVAVVRSLRAIAPDAPIPDERAVVASLVPSATPTAMLERAEALVEAVGFRRTGAAASARHPLVQRAVEIVHERWAEPMSLKTLSADLGVHQHYLGRLFRRETERSFTDYLTETRMEHARYLLASGDRSVGDVARSCGYGDANYFSRVFHRWTGTTPTAFRRGG